MLTAPAHAAFPLRDCGRSLGVGLPGHFEAWKPIYDDARLHERGVPVLKPSECRGAPLRPSELRPRRERAKPAARPKA